MMTPPTPTSKADCPRRHCLYRLPMPDTNADYPRRHYTRRLPTPTANADTDDHQNRPNKYSQLNTIYTYI